MSNTSKKYELVFVYGSLKRGLYNNDVLGDSIYMGSGETKHLYEMRGLGAFPGVHIDSKVSTIKGELFDCSESIMIDLDRLEGYPSFYDRKEVDIILDGIKEEVSGLMYFIASPEIYKGTSIPSGIWEEESYMTEFFSSSRSSK